MAILKSNQFISQPSHLFFCFFQILKLLFFILKKSLSDLLKIRKKK